MVSFFPRGRWWCMYQQGQQAASMFSPPPPMLTVISCLSVFSHIAVAHSTHFKQKKDPKADQDCIHFPTAMWIAPSIGRRKCSIGKRPHGRNMMISFTIYQIWRMGQRDPDSYPKFLPDESKILDPKKWPGVRKRKQVSSHAQVVKDFFKFTWYCEFILSTYSVHSVAGEHRRVWWEGGWKRRLPTS